MEERDLNWWSFRHTCILTGIALLLLWYFDAPTRVLIYAAFVYPTLHLAVNILRK